ncbi:MAG TPA: hypothetical protein QGF02_04315 [Candidatus Babeliales bacterium]|nr:hypothetical protein [Candidatus Babeliales bacterium]
MKKLLLLGALIGVSFASAGHIDLGNGGKLYYTSIDDIHSLTNNNMYEKMANRIRDAYRSISGYSYRVKGATVVRPDGTKAGAQNGMVQLQKTRKKNGNNLLQLKDSGKMYPAFFKYADGQYELVKNY